MAHKPVPPDPTSWRELFSRMTPMMWARFALLVMIPLSEIAVIVAVLITEWR